jgi:hypothetical protein
MFEPERALRVATILTLMSNPPGERRQPKEGDLAGIFDLWFDGGAVKHDSVISVYRFLDGSTAVTGTGPRFSVLIQLHDGTFVEVKDRDRTSLPGLALMDFGAP